MNFKYIISSVSVAAMLTAALFTHAQEADKKDQTSYKYLDWKKNPDAAKTPKDTSSVTNPKAPPAKHFKVEVLSPELFEPMEFVALPDGKILICERLGTLREYDPESGKTSLVAKLDVANQGPKKYATECGFLGLVLDPNYASNHFIYCYYSVISRTPSNEHNFPDGKAPKDEVNRLSRFSYKDGKLDKSSEVIIIEVPHDRMNHTCHEAGSLAFGPDGLLYLATGDNTNPFGKDASPMRPDMRELDARRSAGNTNDLRGKILRLKINPDASYSIPKGNLFPKGTELTRPEIYAMGLRNPYRISVDQKTGTLYWGEVSPDKNPTGDEINQAKSAGFYGWPYFIGDGLRFITPENELTDTNKVINNSRFNTGLKEIKLKPRSPMLHYNRSCAIIGDVYRTNKNNSKYAMPAHFDNCLFFGDWNHSWIKVIRLDENENRVAVENFPINFHFNKVIDFMFVKGELYVLEFGNGWFNTKGGRMTKISFSPEFNQTLASGKEPRLRGADLRSKGATLLQQSSCLACHHSQSKVVGPSFVQLSSHYRKEMEKDENKLLKKLIEKVKKGGSGVWGEVPMTGQPQYKDDDIREMLKTMLNTKKLKK